jgi:hypothetical protein
VDYTKLTFFHGGTLFLLLPQSKYLCFHSVGEIVSVEKHDVFHSRRSRLTAANRFSVENAFFEFCRSQSP